METGVFEALFRRGLAMPDVGREGSEGSELRFMLGESKSEGLLSGLGT